jgi:hypothetical protein
LPPLLPLQTILLLLPQLLVRPIMMELPVLVTTCAVSLFLCCHTLIKLLPLLLPLLLLLLLPQLLVRPTMTGPPVLATTCAVSLAVWA